MKLSKKLVFFLIFSVVFGYFSVSTSKFVNADDGDDIDPNPDGFDEGTKKNFERIVTIDNDGSSVKMVSKLKNSDDKDEFSIDITTNNELSFKGLYKSHTDNNHINLEFQLRFYTIIEYIDTDNDGAYTDDFDSYIGEYDIDEFLPIEYTTGNAHILVIQTSDDVFLARIFAVEGITDINGIIVTSMEVKIDFEIHNFPFTESESRLALLVHFQTNAAYGWNEKSYAEQQGYEDDETELEMKNREAKGYFSWANTATADGQEVEVTGNSLKESGNVKKIYLNYPHATNIIHDPKIGIVGDVPNITVYVLIGTIAAIAIGGVFIFAKKKFR